MPAHHLKTKPDIWVSAPSTAFFFCLLCLLSNDLLSNKNEPSFFAVIGITFIATLCRLSAINTWEAISGLEEPQTISGPCAF